MVSRIDANTLGGRNEKISITNRSYWNHMDQYVMWLSAS